MSMDQDSVKADKAKLDAKIADLQDFTGGLPPVRLPGLGHTEDDWDPRDQGSDEFKALHMGDKSRLLRQLAVMQSYAKILQERIEGFEHDRLHAEAHAQAMAGLEAEGRNASA